MNHFCKYTAHAPYVDGLVVLLLGQDDLWGSVPPRHHTVGKFPFLLLQGRTLFLLSSADFALEQFLLFSLLLRIAIFVDLLSKLLSEIFKSSGVFILFWHSPCKAKIANFHAAVWIYQKVAWFDISMNYVSRMHKVQSTEWVVEYGYYVVFRQLYWWVRAKQLFHVTFHDFKHKENVVKNFHGLLVVGWLRVAVHLRALLVRHVAVNLYVLELLLQFAAFALFYAFHFVWILT